MTDFKLGVRNSPQFGRHLEINWKYVNCNAFFFLLPFLFVCFSFFPPKETYSYSEQRLDRLRCVGGGMFVEMLYFTKTRSSPISCPNIINIIRL